MGIMKLLWSVVTSWLKSKNCCKIVLTVDDKIILIKQNDFIFPTQASYFQRADVALMGVKKFFSDASLEEREHAQMLIDYVNLRGGHAEFGNIEVRTMPFIIFQLWIILFHKESNLSVIGNRLYYFQTNRERKKENKKKISSAFTQ